MTELFRTLVKEKPLSGRVVIHARVIAGVKSSAGVLIDPRGRYD